MLFPVEKEKRTMFSNKPFFMHCRNLFLQGVPMLLTCLDPLVADFITPKLELSLNSRLTCLFSNSFI